MVLNIRKGNVVSPYAPKNRKASQEVSLMLYKKHNKRCFHCKKKLRWLNRGEDRPTSDHLYSKNDIRRALSDEHVLSCWRCNQDRNNEENWRIFRDYNISMFPYAIKNNDSRYDFELLTNGHLKINGMYADKYFDNSHILNMVKFLFELSLT